MTTSKTFRPTALVGMGAVLALSLAACGDDGGGGAAEGEDETIGVSLITKNSTNPFFVAMQEGAKKEAEANSIDLTLAAGKEDGDETTQIQAIEEAVVRGDAGILITPNGPGVNPAITKARDAGLYVIALDTPPDPPDIVDITFATDNFKAGELIGQWTAETLDGEKATIALLDVFDDKIVSVDYNRDQGFLTGMGIDTADPKKNGDEAPTGTYSAGAGGDYEIVCNEPTQGAEDEGRTAMENCLTINGDINVVYAINEPAAIGANNALEAAGMDVIVVSVDGGCAGVQAVADGVIGATSQQYPLNMATQGVEAINTIARGGEAPTTSEGLDFFDTGVSLVTDAPVDGVESIDTTEGAELCWG
ncbi:MAG: substrate-binding domain-containing protein [Ornithinimicrobium sp.]